MIFAGKSVAVGDSRKKQCHCVPQNVYWCFRYRQ